MASKNDLIEKLIREFRTSSNQDDAFDSLAAECLGVSESDLRCLNIVENNGGISAGELAVEAGLTAGAVTGVIDRLEKIGYARRTPDPNDRRRVRVEVTPTFYRAAEPLWGPMAAEWQSMLARRFTIEELERITAFLRATNDLARRHLDRLRNTP
jgi:DNA-binding MarR family transcriptional regulator